MYPPTPRRGTSPGSPRKEGSSAAFVASGPRRAAGRSGIYAIDSGIMQPAGREPTVTHFDSEVCRHLDRALEREWLDTNGIGGFASSTIAGLNTRRYHGLLVAATRPPVGRVVVLSKLEETLVVDGARTELSANRYPGAVHPRGFELMRECRLDPFPTFVYDVGSLALQKTVFPIRGRNATAVTYELSRDEGTTPPGAVTLELRPLVAFRDYHSLVREGQHARWHTWFGSSVAAVRPERWDFDLRLAHDASRVEPVGEWYRRFEYVEEERRGLDYVEDLYCPFVLTFDLTARATASVAASIDAGVDVARLDEYRQAEIARRRAIVGRASTDEPLVRTLTAAADHYVVDREAGKTVIAGYHWFSDWGRDTMIALPGLTLATGRPEIARSILEAFARHVDRGMLPNRFPDTGEAPEYNNIDSTLWYFEAIRAYLAATGDSQLARDLYPVLVDIVDWHLRGTRYGIRADADGLLAGGEPGVQLTWMDAKVGDWVVTPRHGKPVEIQALWHNALRVLASLATVCDPDARERYVLLADRARESFNARFWNDARGCLYDVVDGPDGDDGSLRPNQVFAVSLDQGLLPPERALAVVDVVERELLTPMGLRTLAPADARYQSRYEGGVASRDGAYHQGTVWPWLLGPFVTAYVRVHGGSAAARNQAAAWLRALEPHLSTAGLGHVSEIFDAEAPHAPRGCIAQAWSVAELLRCAVDDVFAPRW
ncbi:MAG: amylo-alpha-1,6-glucosidase [Vicinamibacterales bacterium]